MPNPQPQCRLAPLSTCEWLERLLVSQEALVLLKALLLSVDDLRESPEGWGVGQLVGLQLGMTNGQQDVRSPTCEQHA